MIVVLADGRPPDLPSAAPPALTPPLQEAAVNGAPSLV